MGKDYSPAETARSGKLPSNAAELADPEGAAAIITAHADPFDKLVQAAEACGMPSRTASRIVQRLKTRYLPVKEATEEITTRSLQRMLDDRAHMALAYMDDKVFAEANLRDLSIALGILLEKRQLLKGEPTQILSVGERKNMNDLLPEIVAEAQRRGMTIDMTPVEATDEVGVHARLIESDLTVEESVDNTKRKMRPKLDRMKKTK